MYPERVAGEAFGINYQNWTANTVVTLANVPWNNDYRDVVRFPGGLEALDAWIDAGETAQLKPLSMAKFNQKIKIDTPINRAMRYNYLRASNPAMPVEGDVQKNYYYFIIGIEYEGPKTTVLTLQLDVWSTFIYDDIQFGKCYIERGHIGIANTNAFQQYGRSYLTVPEGLDTGGEYRIVHTEHEKIMDTVQVDAPDNVNAGYDILVCSTADLTQNPIDSKGGPSLNSAKGGKVQGMPSGQTFYIFKSAVALEAFFTAYTNYPWITQSITSITLIPNMGRWNDGNYDYGPNLSSVSGVEYYAGPAATGSRAKRSKLTAWRNKQFIKNILGSRYVNLKKFFTYPYMVIEMTSWNGSPLIIKPEAWQDPDATVRELVSLMPPGQRIAMVPNRYNADAETSYSIPDDNGVYPAPPAGGNSQTDVQSAQNPDDFGDFLDFATILDNFPTLPIVNDMAAAYLAANRNGIAFQFRSAEYGRTRAVAAGQAGADVAAAQIGNTARQSGISQQATNAQAELANQMALQRGLLGIGTGAAQMNPGAMIGSTASAAFQGEQANADAAIRNLATASSAGSDVQTAASIRDTNQGFANFAANGDYSNTVAGIQAKLQDTQLTQPSTSGQFGGDAFNIINGLFGYSLRWKMMNLNSLRTIGDYWLRYGYAIHQFSNIPADFRCMEKFTYWKLSETYLTRAFIPEVFKQVIRGIFEKGVTVWSDPDDIGVTDLADNAPLTNISY